ncbi:YbhB/YbcL family Raf kinase inhibitor-like protein [Mucilaginibacter sp.]
MKTRSILMLSVVILSLLAFVRKDTLKVSSTAFSPYMMIPAQYTCDGPGMSPPLTISNIPAGTNSLAIIVHDPDAPHPGGVTHWVAWNLPVNGTIPENFVGGKQGYNSDKKTGYKAPCPPEGTHRYTFKVYALDELLTLDTTTDKPALEKAMKGHILAQGELIGLYSKNK